MPEQSPPCRVLVVGGSEGNYPLLFRTLRLDGHEIVHATDHAAAVQAISADPPRVIVVTAQPDGDAISVIRRLRSSDPTRLVPILLLSSDDSIDARVAATDAGADEFLATPFRAAALRTRIRFLIVVDDQTTRRRRMRRAMRRDQ